MDEVTRNLSDEAYVIAYRRYVHRFPPFDPRFRSGPCGIGFCTYDILASGSFSA